MKRIIFLSALIGAICGCVSHTANNQRPASAAANKKPGPTSVGAASDPGGGTSSSQVTSATVAGSPTPAATQSVTNLPPGKTPVALIRAPASGVPARATTRNTPMTNGTVSVNTRIRASKVIREIKLTPTGAKADFGRHKAYFSSDIGGAAPPITLVAPDGKTLAFRPTFLVFANRANGQSILIGQITNRIGEIILPDRVVWTNAFEGNGPIVDIEWRYLPNGCEQNFIWRDNPAPSLPEGWQPEDVAIECWTEAFSSPVSVASSTAVLRQETVDVPSVQVPDQTINFASMKIVAAGRAFSIGDDQDSVPVAKTWNSVQPETLGADPRHFIIEQVDYLSVKAKLDSLPKAAGHASATPPKSSRSELLHLYASHAANQGRTGNQQSSRMRGDSTLMLMAKAPSSSGHGFVLDFTIINSIPVPPGIVSWWPAGDNALDAVTNHNDGTLQNLTTFVSGEVGRAFSFSGDGDFVEVPDAPSLNPTNGLTIDGWVYVTAENYEYARDIVSKDGEYWDRQYLLTDTDGDNFRAHVGLTNGFYYIDGTNTVPLNTWTHFAMTYDQTNLILYFNGVEEARGAASGPLIVTTQPVRIGGGSPDGTPPYYLPGLVDEPDIFNRALSATEIKAIYDAGAAGKINPNCVALSTNAVGWWPGDGNVYDLAHANVGTLQNGAGFTSGVVGQCFSFNGIDQNFEVPDSPDLNPTNITVETWVYVTGNSDTHRDIISKDGESADRQFILTVSDQNTFRAHVGLDEGLVWFDGNTTVALNTWYHAAMTYDGTDLNLYVNGVPDGSVTPVAGGPIITTTQPVRIGGGDGGPPEDYGGWYFAGLIDEPTIYNRALTGAEISAIYSAGCAGKCKTVPSGYDGTSHDGHGTPDAWYLQHGLDPLTPGIADQDPNGNGVPNWQEYLRGGDPLALEAFKIWVGAPSGLSNLP